VCSDDQSSTFSDFGSFAQMVWSLVVQIVKVPFLHALLIENIEKYEAEFFDANSLLQTDFHSSKK
jgi:hypothetical protein